MGSDHHQMKITAESIASPSTVFFGYSPWSSSVGHYTWVSHYSIGDKGVWLSLVLPDGSHGEPVNARFKFSLLDRAGRRVPSRTQASSFQNWVSHQRWEWICSAFITKEDLKRPELLDDDNCFTIQCDVSFEAAAKGAGGACVLDTPAVPPSDLNRHLGTLLEEKDGADVTFQVVGAGGETFAAHRCVLAARSPVFRAQLFGEFKESKWYRTLFGEFRAQLFASVPILIDDVDAKVFRSLLKFIYTDSLSDTDDDEDGAPSHYQRLLAAADRYGLERMKLICQEKLCKYISASSVATLLALAERHHCRGLKEACFDFLSSSANLESFTETDGFDQLIGSCPGVLKELLANLAASLMF